VCSSDLVPYRRLDRHEALRQMTQSYIDRMHSNEPVHTWSLD